VLNAFNHQKGASVLHAKAVVCAGFDDDELSNFNKTAAIKPVMDLGVVPVDTRLGRHHGV